MKRSEHVHIPSEHVLAQFGIDNATKLETDTIGHEGLLQATITQNVPDFATKWLPAFEEIGIDANYAVSRQMRRYVTHPQLSLGTVTTLAPLSIPAL